MEQRGRTALTVIVVVLVLGVPLAFLFASGGGGDDDRPQAAEPGLRLEGSAGSPELVVYVEAAANEPDRAGGARSVTLRCVDADGRLVAAQDEAWPFTDTDAGTLDPHTHVTLDADRMGQIRRCSLVGTEPPLEGSLP
jgi:hypothetical protein